VHGRKLRNIETVGENTVWFSLQKMFAFVCRDVGDSGENIARVGRSSFNAVSVVDATLSSLGIHIEILQVIVEINGTSTEVPSEESRVGGEDGGDIDSAPFAEWESYTG
jgi:hypothetical protein